MANSMQLKVSNLNAQLAFFRKEMETDPDFVKSWKKICEAKKARDVSDIFLRDIENPTVKNYAKRREYSKIIFYKMKKF